jgi:hypothetical protein
MAYYTQTHLDALDAAIATGFVQSMTFGDQSVTFRSLNDMLKLRALMVRLISGESGTRYAAHSKGA